MKQALKNRGSRVPEHPEKPKFRSLAKVAKAVEAIPYVIEFGDLPECEDELLHEDNFVVALAPLKYRSFVNYENRYRESIEVAVMRVMWVLETSFRIMKITEEMADMVAKGEDISKMEIPEIDADEEGNTKTPYGTMRGSVHKNLVEIAAYILAQHGRIVARHEDGTYEYEPVSSDAIIDRLDPHAMQITTEEGKSVFLEIIEVAGIFDSDAIRDSLEESNELEDDELKNSPLVPKEKS
jgi:hypothetical protein